MTISTLRHCEQSFTWGQGETILDVFLEPTCPFSVLTFNKLPALLNQAGEDRLQIKIRLQSQPWHLFSGIIVRYILAASTLPDGQQAVKKVMQSVADHREEFEFIDHCRGPNMQTTPEQLLERLVNYSKIDVREIFNQAALQNLIKWQAKYARQNGIHVSPTFMINGLIQAEMSSQDTIEQWLSKLGLDNPSNK
ncbi:DsbA family protein [Rosenbergiella australiborealis]|uniref:Thioredoxin domain-containing protein n=1 Tax=Rosenbergiella australiborealis TaxID=1544696 RepID=A0ABS5T1Z4_9GAMM|nr:thioredoxin domain-containing protein [Rosenbergiella australiborealis]MBT0726361.1 thioredoxin domain-containing protein [Rosenbergiella australiborealis]